jgi:hypothetical protein
MLHSDQAILERHHSRLKSRRVIVESNPLVMKQHYGRLVNRFR